MEAALNRCTCVKRYLEGPDGPQACRTYCGLVGEAGLVKEALPIRRASADLYFILLPWVFSPGQGTGRILREYLLIEYERDTVPWGKY